MSARTFLPRSLSIVAVTVALAACSAAGASSVPGGGGAASQPPGGAGPSLPPAASVASTAPGASAAVVTGHVGDKEILTVNAALGSLLALILGVSRTTLAMARLWPANSSSAASPAR